MKRASWILGSLAVCTLAACGGGNRGDTTTGGAGSETGTMGGDTAAMSPGATPMDTAMTGTGTMGSDTAAMDTSSAR
jgi:hypothetical protein